MTAISRFIYLTSTGYNGALSKLIICALKNVPQFSKSRCQRFMPQYEILRMKIQTLVSGLCIKNKKPTYMESEPN